jgi:hypothetical protein
MTDSTRELTNNLLAMPGHLAFWRNEVIVASFQVEDVERALALQEQTLLLEGVEGKNAEERKARLEMLTGEARALVLAARREVVVKKSRLAQMEDEFSALKAVARVIAGRDE